MKLVPNKVVPGGRILVVGDAPDAWSAKDGNHFYGTCGSMVADALLRAGASLNDVSYVNVSPSQIPHATLLKQFGTRNGVDAELDMMLEILQLAIERANPNVIVPLGSLAYKLCTGIGEWKKVMRQGRATYDYAGIAAYRGSIVRGVGPVAEGRKCVGAVHPRDVLRQGHLRPVFAADIARAVAQSQFPEIRLPNPHIVIAPDGVERAAWISWLKGPAGERSPSGAVADSFLTVDIEFVGTTLICVGLTRSSDCAVVFRTRNSTEIADVKHILESGVPLCFQNGMFDCGILEWHFGMSLFPSFQHDTLVGMHVCYTELPKDLGFIGSIFTEHPVWWDKISWPAIKKGKQPVEDVLQYNGIDVVVTHEAMIKMLNDELLDPVLRAEYDYEMSLMHPLWECSKLGVNFDAEHVGLLDTELRIEELEASIAVANIAGGEMVNLRSNAQMVKLLTETLGFKKSELRASKAGGVKADDFAIAELIATAKHDHQREALREVRKARKAANLQSKFTQIELDDDGRFRCIYNPAKTVTSRLSSATFFPTGRGSNLQNIPKDKRVRAAFRADPGYAFIYADLKSAESYVVAHITNDKEMLRLHSPEYMSGLRDGHKFVAAFLLDKEVEDVTDDERYIGKQCRHALNYMMGWRTLQERINKSADETGVWVTAAQSKVFVQKYRALHQALPLWWNQVGEELRRTRSVTTLLGRRRTFYEAPDRVLPEAVAFIPQGTIAKALNLGLLSCANDPELKRMGYQLLMQVHDAIGFQVPIANLREALPQVERNLTLPITIARRAESPYEIQVPVDMKVGFNWGEANPKKNYNPRGLRDVATFYQQEGL